MIIDIVLGLSIFLLSLPVFVLITQILLASFCKLKPGTLVASAPSVAVLIPAHNESTGISRTLASVYNSLGNNHRVIVVADNCTDNTAELARAAGALVIERSDEVKKGKGFALDFGLKYLSDDPPEVLIILDADCLIDKEFLPELAKMAVKTGRPVQALDLMVSPQDGTLKLRIAEFTWCIKNHVRPLGWAMLGLPCQLMGTGMAFPWHLTSRMNFSDGNLVEDMKLGVDLTNHGYPPVFFPAVKVTSEFPTTSEALKSQRTRWEHGHLAMILATAPRLIISSFFKRNFFSFALAIDLMVPPLALLVGLLLALLFSSIVWGYHSANYHFFWLSLLLVSLFFSSVLLAWIKFGSKIISFHDLLLIPFYMFRKIPIYFSFFFNRQKKWIRTGRK